MTATLFSLDCPKCGDPISPTACNTGEMTPCGRCGTRYQALVFPAILRTFEMPAAGAGVIQAEESSCYYHSAKKAVTVCESCGVFLCALCDVSLNNQHLCPKCIEKGKAKGRMKHLENQRILYDDMALRLALYPVLLVITVYFTFMTAPAALFIAIRYWNAPGSIIGRSKFRMVLAILFATLQILGWIMLCVWFATH